jgi:hypothetical protein
MPDAQWTDAIEAIRVASFEDPRAASHSEWSERIEAILSEHCDVRAARLEWWAHPEHQEFVNELLDHAPESYDGDEAAEAIAIRYVRDLEATARLADDIAAAHEAWAQAVADDTDEETLERLTAAVMAKAGDSTTHANRRRPVAEPIRDALANAMSRHSLTADHFERADEVLADLKRDGFRLSAARLADDMAAVIRRLTENWDPEELSDPCEQDWSPGEVAALRHARQPDPTENPDA